MKQLQRIGLVATAIAVMALAWAASASGTALEIGGVLKNEQIRLDASLKEGTSLVLATTGGEVVNTCTVAHVTLQSTSPYINNTVGGPVSFLSSQNAPKDRLLSMCQGVSR
jgi:hypothetical protein